MDTTIDIDYFDDGDIMEEKIDSTVWDKKDRRMVRMNCLSHATAVCISDSERNNARVHAEDITRLAKELEKYVYEGM